MKKIIIILLMCVILSFNVLGFGVSSPYFSDNPLILQPGESRDVVLTMQNLAGATEDLQVKAEIVDGNNIAEIIDEDVIYDVPAGADDVKTNLEVTMPEDANPGDEWNVAVEFKTVNQRIGGIRNHRQPQVREHKTSQGGGTPSQ